MSQKGSKLLDMLQELKRKYAAVEMDNEQLRQQLAAEQAKSAEIWQELLELRAERESDRQECSACSSHKDKLLATIAAMRSALEVARHDLVTSHNLLATDRQDLVLLNNTITGFHGIKPMTALSGNKIVWMTDNSAGIGAIEQALSNTAGAEYSRVKKLEDAAQAVCARLDETDKNTTHYKVRAAIDNLQAVLGEGKA